LTAVRSSGDVATVGALAKAGATRGGTIGFAEAGDWNAGTEGTFAGIAVTGAVAVCGASDSGAAGFAATALSGLIALPPGRSLGIGTGSDDQAACTFAVTIAKAKVVAMDLKICTFPPQGGHCTTASVWRIYARGELNKS
jgi:hypothetical protein